MESLAAVLQSATESGMSVTISLPGTCRNQTASSKSGTHGAVFASALVALRVCLCVSSALPQLAAHDPNNLLSSCKSELLLHTCTLCCHTHPIRAGIRAPSSPPLRNSSSIPPCLLVIFLSFSQFLCSFLLTPFFLHLACKSTKRQSSRLLAAGHASALPGRHHDLCFAALRCIMADSGWLQWAYILAGSATGMTIVMIAQTANSYWTAYRVAPQEVASFIDTLDFSIEENEGYDRDVSKVQRLEDKIRLNRLLREIQRIGDDLRDDLNHLVREESATTLRTSSRIMWASKRAQIEERMKRLDSLRMRFMMAYLGIITSIAEKQPPPPPPLPEKTAAYTTPTRLSAKKSLDDLPKRTPSRRLTTQAIGHHEHVETPQRSGWAGVVQELQMSPRMRARHASIEKLMESPTQ